MNDNSLLNLHINVKPSDEFHSCLHLHTQISKGLHLNEGKIKSINEDGATFLRVLWICEDVKHPSFRAIQALNTNALSNDWFFLLESTPRCLWLISSPCSPKEWVTRFANEPVHWHKYFTCELNRIHHLLEINILLKLTKKKKERWCYVNSIKLNNTLRRLA